MRIDQRRAEGPTHEKKPLVSVGVTVYNAEKYLAKTLESLVHQDYDNLDIVICDNASQDSTEQICRSFQSKDPRIKYHRNVANVGSHANGTQAIQLSAGEYFFLAADHDIYEPTFVSKLLQVQLDDPSVVLSFPQTLIIDGNDKPVKLASDKIDTRGMSPEDAYVKFLSEIAWGNAYRGLFRMETMLKVLPIPGVISGDLVMLARTVLHGAITQHSEPLFLRREIQDHSSVDGQSQRQMNQMKLDNTKLEAMAPWIMMCNAYAQNILEGPVEDSKKEWLLQRTARILDARFGHFIRSEIESVVVSAIWLLNQDYSSTIVSQLNYSKLLAIADVARAFYPQMPGVDLLSAVGYVKMNLLDIARNFAMRELRNFPVSTGARVILDKISSAELNK